MTRIVRRRDLPARTGLGESTIYELIGAGQFPKPIPLTSKTVGWLESEVEEWLQERIAARERGEAPAMPKGARSKPSTEIEAA